MTDSTGYQRCYRPDVLQFKNRNLILDDIATKTVRHIREDRKGKFSFLSVTEMALRQERYQEIKTLVAELDILDAVENCSDQCDYTGYVTPPYKPKTGVPCLCPAGKMRIQRGEYAQ